MIRVLGFRNKGSGLGGFRVYGTRSPNEFAVGLGFRVTRGKGSGLRFQGYGLRVRAVLIFF